MDTLKGIDVRALRAGRDTDRLIAEIVYQQGVEVDESGELRVAGECGHDPTPGEIDVRELDIVPQYSRHELLAEQAFVLALRRVARAKEAYLCCEPGGVYGDQKWSLRDKLTKKKILTAPTEALLYCQAAILALQGQEDEDAKDQ